MLRTRHGVLTATGPGNGCRNGRAAQPIKFTLTPAIAKNYKYWPMWIVSILFLSFVVGELLVGAQTRCFERLKPFDG
ncbi:hypothetical protein AMELA_G00099480 [Ameiurus melas]|uniref:Uncharacterized protein n=1 Tax=Ameiurus melas TaxID=219545 RepID=A0A7J6AT86_AMEME|nr:hypothetical protein AMELA_G00099480 [Ameiurus melas]